MEKPSTPCPDLQRFLDAQDPIFDQVLAELKAGSKRSHWMWFIFPQMRGLGHSAMAQFYGIASRAEARAYLDHPVLGPRLGSCTRMVNGHTSLTARQIFGQPDDVKFRSCMTLFAAVAADKTDFRTALDLFFDGKPDQLSLDLL